MLSLNTSRSSKRRRGISLVPALFVFVFVMCSAFSMDVLDSSRTTIEKDSSRTVNEKTIAPDTGIVKYDLNDPRNPNCPCHDAQKKADEEYRNSQMQQKQNPAEKNSVNNDHNNDLLNNDQNNVKNGNKNPNSSDVNTNKTTFSSGGGGSQKHYSASYKLQKKMKRWSKKVNRKLNGKNKGTKGGKLRVADCFHWG
ncbi:hypothetical protein BH11BAC7_BH11BAC7_13770 [soil metagenome]